MYQKTSRLTELPKKAWVDFVRVVFIVPVVEEKKTTFYKEKKLDMVLRMFISFIILCMNLL